MGMHAPWQTTIQGKDISGQPRPRQTVFVVEGLQNLLRRFMVQNPAFNRESCVDEGRRDGITRLCELYLGWFTTVHMYAVHERN